MSTNSLSRALLNYDEGDIKSVHYGDILIKYPAILNIKNDKIPYITGGKLEKYKSSLLENGDLIFADAAEDETVGKAVEVNGLTEENLVAGLHTIVARPKDKKAEFFLGYYINSNTYHRQLLRLIQGSKVSSISKGNLQKTLVSFPKDFEEQQKIGSFFKQLDETIALHQRKCEQTKELKKFMLQKMFPKKGEKNPEIRFPGFTDDWEQRKLEKHIIEYHEVTTENNQYPVLTSSRKGIFLQTDYYSGNQVASADNTGYNIVPYGYFTYRHMSDDEIFHFNINDIVENGIVSTLYPVFTTDEKLDSRYLQYQLNYGSEFARFAVLQKQGGSRTYMYLNKLKKLSLTMPTSIDEQKKISSFLMSLDNLITLHQRKCEQLKELKKFMLQNMFPKKG